MKLTRFEDLNKILAIVDSCLTDCKIHFSFNLTKEFFDLTNPENKKGLAIKNYIDRNFDFLLTQDKKQDLINDLAENFEDGEICHYLFIKDSAKIGQGFDYCEINFLNPEYFHLIPEHLEILGDVDIRFTSIID